MFGHRKARREADEKEQEALLLKAEETVRDLTDRRDKAIRILNERNHRNHWRESIERMIQGAR